MTGSSRLHTRKPDKQSLVNGAGRQQHDSGPGGAAAESVVFVDATSIAHLPPQAITSAFLVEFHRDPAEFRPSENLCETRRPKSWPCQPPNFRSRAVSCPATFSVWTPQSEDPEERNRQPEQPYEGEASTDTTRFHRVEILRVSARCNVKCVSPVTFAYLCDSGSVWLLEKREERRGLPPGMRFTTMRVVKINTSV